MAAAAMAAERISPGYSGAHSPGRATSSSFSSTGKVVGNVPRARKENIQTVHVALVSALLHRLDDQDARHQEQVRLQEERQRAHEERIGEAMQQHEARLGEAIDRLGEALQQHALQTATLMAALAPITQRDGSDGKGHPVSAPAAAAAAADSVYCYTAPAADIVFCHCCGEDGHFRSGCPMLLIS